ncbi:acyl carrier protein [Streptomyces sp. NBC_00887]|uniref:acyl carrier protein n=1 Tax=Streptomyces sp. NBC_00887 TaxID=2975859 RepID=UPI002F917B1A|nr:acyl carrier protein [Streptomyces sp. NBC_00887]
MYERLKAIMVDVLLLDSDRVRPDATLEQAGVDSLTVVELSLVLSQHHGIEISDDELIELETVADIAALMEQHPASDVSR